MKIIKRHENRDNIIYILDDKLEKSKDKCFIECVSRLVNCLSGFYDDINVKISDSKQISIIITKIKNNIGVSQDD